MRLTAKPLAAILFIILFGGVALTSALGWWHTTTTHIPATYADGSYNPADIRGSYTLGEVSELFAVPLEDLRTAFRLPADADAAQLPVKSLESQFEGLPTEIGTSSLRLFVALYRGLPYELSGDTYLPGEAVDLLLQKASLTPEQTAYLQAHRVDVAQAATEPPAAASTPSAGSEPDAAERAVTGKTTFQMVLDWDVPADVLAGLVGGGPLPAPDTLVKDYCAQQGLSFPEVKPLLQAEVDKITP